MINQLSLTCATYTAHAEGSSVQGSAEDRFVFGKQLEIDRENGRQHEGLTHSGGRRTSEQEKE
jgi:hypothetical protein